MSYDRPIRVIFVCAGNICRSPMAEAVFRHLVNESKLSDRFEIASAGTGDWHVGEKPHVGTQAVLQRYGVEVGDKRALHFTARELSHYDYVIVMDDENRREVQRLRGDVPAKVQYLLDFAPQKMVREVPDPYYTGGFEQVYDLVLAGCQGLLDHLRANEERVAS